MQIKLSLPNKTHKIIEVDFWADIYESPTKLILGAFFAQKLETVKVYRPQENEQDIFASGGKTVEMLAR